MLKSALYAVPTVILIAPLVTIGVRLIRLTLESFRPLLRKGAQGFKRALKLNAGEQTQEVAARHLWASKETTDFLLDYIKDAPELQFDISDKLDAKLYSVFAAATVAIGLASRIPVDDAASIDTIRPFGIETVDLFFYLVVIAYALTLVAAVLHLLTRQYRASAQASQLWDKRRLESVRRLKLLLLEDISEAHAHNAAVLRLKARTVNCAVWATGCEGFYIVLALIFGR